ncbi:unnamed protein product [Vicia faba]|uniref:Uncharacterized protein n=1 Tax=Vicia faba TaxID=3906 RepID=A0AAV0ZEG5_VICFA|nr:unnamed protein product [Vicia faba]
MVANLRALKSLEKRIKWALRSVQDCYQPLINSSMSSNPIPNWNWEGTRLSYDSAAETDYTNEDMIEEFLMGGCDARPSTQPQNEEGNRRTGQRTRRAPSCETHRRLTRPGQNR